MNEISSLMALQSQMLTEAARQELRDCNAVSGQFGLCLSEDEINELIECRQIALKNTGRIEFSGGILPRLIDAFCDSPYLSPHNYVSTLAELQEAFYYFKSDAEERYTDDELIEWMEKVFHGRAQGCAEYLLATSLDDLRRYAREVFDPQDTEEAGDLF
ncbi:MAG: DUF6323 family protein [Faecalibacterium sp.]